MRSLVYLLGALALVDCTSSNHTESHTRIGLGDGIDVVGLWVSSVENPQVVGISFTELRVWKELNFELVLYARDGSSKIWKGTEILAGTVDIDSMRLVPSEYYTDDYGRDFMSYNEWLIADIQEDRMIVVHTRKGSTSHTGYVSQTEYANVE